LRQFKLIFSLILSVSLILAKSVGISANDSNKYLRPVMPPNLPPSIARIYGPPYSMLDPDSNYKPVTPPIPFTEPSIPNPDDIYWSDGFGLNVTDGGWANKIVEYKGQYIIGGHFNFIGNVKSRNIAVWDGRRWGKVGNGVYGDVEAMVVHDGRLFVAGTFKTLEKDKDTVNYIASWDGLNWSRLRNGLNNPVSDMIVYNNNIVVAGSFDSASGVLCKGVASWDGINWSAIESGINRPGKYANRLGVFGNNLIVGGSFDSVGSMAASRIVSWDGTSWHPLGSGLNGTPENILVYNGKLIATGNFTEAGGIPVGYVGQWDGSIWSSLAGGTNSRTTASAIFENRLIVGGGFSIVGGDSIKNIAAWNGTEWQSMNQGFENVPSRWFYNMDAIRDSLFLTGIFAGPPGKLQYVSNLLVRDDSNWMPVICNGLNDFLLDATAYKNQLIVGGYPQAAGTVLSDKIFAFDKQGWHSMSEKTTGQFLPAVVKFGFYDEKLIVGGHFDSIGGIAANSIAAWDGKNWFPLGEGVNGFAHNFALYRGKLIVAGSFTTAGGKPANHLAAWDGRNWTTLGSGPSGQFQYIFTIKVYEDNLFVGGLFDSMNGIPARGLAIWDGVQWSTIAGAIISTISDAGVSELEIFDDKLIVGGFYDSIGGIAANRIASWDGTNWSPLGSGLHDWDAYLSAMTVFGDKLVVGGSFDSAGDISVNSIAAWDGRVWSTFGSGLKDAIYLGGGWPAEVYALTTYDDILVVGGWFYMAGDKVSSNIAMWTKKSGDWQFPKPMNDIAPDNFALKQNYPNPFNPSTNIEYTLAQPGHVVLEIYNVLGQKVSTIVDEEQFPGLHRIQWDGTSSDGQTVSSGIYFYKLTAGSHIESKKMMLIR